MIWSYIEDNRILDYLRPNMSHEVVVAAAAAAVVALNSYRAWDGRRCHHPYHPHHQHHPLRLLPARMHSRTLVASSVCVFISAYMENLFTLRCFCPAAAAAAVAVAADLASAHFFLRSLGLG